MSTEIFEALETTLEVSGVVFFMMILVDFFDVQTRGKIKKMVSKSKLNQYFTASFLGATPGCLGAYANASMYMHGFLGLGAVSSGLIATSGDEAFVMLAQFPKQALLLFGLLFVLAIPFGYVLDIIAKKLNIKPCTTCGMHKVHAQDNKRDYKHYFTVHIWNHIFKKHVIRIFLWTLASMLLIKLGMHYYPLEDFIQNNLGWVILIAAIIGLIPSSGPHLIFVSLFATGVIPFSVLLTSSISQDGHGALPLLSYSLRDTTIIKTYNLLVGLVVGWLTWLIGF